MQALGELLKRLLEAFGKQLGNTLLLLLALGGMAVELLSNKLIVTLDLYKTEYWPLGYVSGLQVQPYTDFFIRGGVKNGGFTFGAGYRFVVSSYQLHADYGFVPDPVAPRGNHVFTWSFVF